MVRGRTLNRRPQGYFQPHPPPSDGRLAAGSLRVNPRPPGWHADTPRAPTRGLANRCPACRILRAPYAENVTAPPAWKPFKLAGWAANTAERNDGERGPEPETIPDPLEGRRLGRPILRDLHILEDWRKLGLD